MIGYIQFILRNRIKIIILLMLITAGFAASASRGKIGSSLANLLFGENPAYYSYLERVQKFSTDDVVIIAYEDADLLSPASLKKLKKASDRIEKIDAVWRLDNLLTAQKTFTDENGTLVVEKYVDLLKKPGANREQIKKEMIDDPFIGGLLISPSGADGSVIIEMKIAEEFSIEDGPQLIEDIFNIFLEEGFPDPSLHRIGNLAVMSEVTNSTYFNLTRLFPIVCLVLLVTVYLMYRRIWPVFVTFAVAFMADIWMLGFAVMLDKQINIFITLSPGIILIVATSDVIHLCSSYLLELASGKSKDEAILKSGSEVGAACLLTSLTTFVGFVSMSFIPTPVFRQMGWTLGFGVAVSLLIAMTLVPIIFSFMPAPKQWRLKKGEGDDFLDKLVNRSMRLSTARPIAVIAVFIIFLGASIYGISVLRIDTDFSKRLDEENRVRLDGDYFQERFAGAQYLNVYLDAPVAGGALDIGFYNKAVEFDRQIEALPGVDSALSFVDLIDLIHTEYASAVTVPGGATGGPDSREALAQYLLLFEMGGGEAIEKVVDFDRRSTAMAVRVSPTAVREIYDIGIEIEKLADDIFPKDVDVEVTGISYLAGEWLDQILIGQSRGLLFAFITIAIMMMVGLRSFSVGAWTMLPNMLPLLALGGLAGLMLGTVDSDVLGLAMIAIGIGVDDTIHFFMRFRLERQKTDDNFEAIKNTFHFSGRAIIVTSIILIAGFLPFMLSDYFSIWMFGSLLPYTLFVALAADLFLAPALITVGLIRYRSK